MSESHRVFVYGTLMRGEYHHDFLHEARYEGEGRTHPRYSLIWMEYYPALLQGGPQAVRGEVYRVSDAELQRLDVLEEHPHVYIRSQDTLADGTEVQLYVLRPEHAVDAEPVPSGDFRDVPAARRRP